MVRWFVVLGILLISFPLATPVLGQGRSPGVDDAGPRTVSPRECTVDSLPVDTLIRVLGLDADGIPAQPPLTITSPLGQLVDDATLIRIELSVRGVLACLNAGDLPRAATWMTEAGMQRVYGGLTTDLAARHAAKTRLAASPQPRAEEECIRLLAVSDVSTLPDGRVATFVTMRDPLVPPGGPKTVLMVFADTIVANQSRAWLLDDWVDFSMAPVAMPTATRTA